jgi:hypothetical protein
MTQEQETQEKVESCSSEPQERLQSTEQEQSVPIKRDTAEQLQLRPIMVAPEVRLSVESEEREVLVVQVVMALRAVVQLMEITLVVLVSVEVEVDLVMEVPPYL